MSEEETVYAYVTIEVEVHLETIHVSPREIPEEYLTVRLAEVVRLELLGNPAAGPALIDHRGSDELDPDGLLTAAVGTALLNIEKKEVPDE